MKNHIIKHRLKGDELESEMPPYIIVKLKDNYLLVFGKNESASFNCPILNKWLKLVTKT